MLKKTTSLTLAFSGIVVLVSSTVLYLGPPGHIGHFSSWSFWGLNKHYWGALHLNSGILFCLAMLLHSYFNWQLLLSYAKRKKQTPVKSFTPLVTSLVLTLFVCFGSYFDMAPMKQIMGYARGLRVEVVKQYGSPPYGYSTTYPIAVISGYMGWDIEMSLQALKERGIDVCSPQQPFKEVAANNGTTIGHLLDIMSSQKREFSHETLSAK